MHGRISEEISEWLAVYHDTEALSHQTGTGGIISGLIGEDYPGSVCQMSPGWGLVETQTLG